VSSSCNGEALARKRTVVAVLRLVVEGHGGLVHGEVVTASGRVVARFRTWTDLLPAVQEWLGEEGAREDPGDVQGTDRAPENRAQP
jgi:hypothetical protein